MYPYICILKKDQIPSTNAKIRNLKKNRNKKTEFHQL